VLVLLISKPSQYLRRPMEHDTGDDLAWADDAA
jgi:hypothetical protein